MIFPTHEEYQNKTKRLNRDEDLETACYKVAWSAVKRKYRKGPDGYWVDR